MTFFIPRLVSAESAELWIAGHALVWGGACDPGGRKILAGSRYFLTVWNRSDRSAQVLTREWPAGYFLEAALDLPQGNPFIPNKSLIEQLNPERFLSQVNRSAEKRFLLDPSTFAEHEWLNAKCFVLTVPPALAGHTLSFRVRFEDDGQNSISTATAPIYIIAPCDRNDTARIVASRIYEANTTGNYRRGVEIADSMLKCGLTDASGWDYAEAMARGLEMYDKALSYLQRIYEDFGVLGVGLNTANPPKYNANIVRDPQMQQLYAEKRNQLMQLKAAQEQEQQQK